MATTSQLEALAEVGSVLGPLFLYDPRLDAQSVGPLYEMLASADANSLAAEWPFVEESEVANPLAVMTQAARDHLRQTESSPLGPRDAAADAPGSLTASEAIAPLEAKPSPDALTEDYRRLFVGPARKAAPPWGSVYTDKDQVIFGSSTLELRAWLRHHGVAVIRQGESDEPEDHIGTLLLMTAWLARERPELLDEFLQLHLLPWAPHFLEVMEAAAEHPFFKALASLTRQTLEGAQQALALEVNTPRFYR